MSSSTEERIQEAIAAAKRGDRASARDLLGQIVRQEPGNAHAWYILSQVVDRPEQAIYCLERALQTQPSPQIQTRLDRLRAAAGPAPAKAQPIGQAAQPDPAEPVTEAGPPTGAPAGGPAIAGVLPAAPANAGGTAGGATARRERRGWGLCGVLLGLAILGTLLTPLMMFLDPLIREQIAAKKQRFEQPFIDQMDSYTRKRRTTPKTAMLQGKILVINPTNKTVDDLYYELDEDQRAQTPEEVGVLVWMDCREGEAHYYLGQTGSYFAQQEICPVTVIDWKTQQVVGQKEFSGSEPPESLQADANGFVRESDRKKVEQAVNVSRELVLNWLFTRLPWVR